MSISVTKRADSNYPELLAQIADPPRQLYITGKLLTNLPLVAIVGSRKHSHYGKEITYRLAGELASKGIGIVSGLALGCDAIAHRGAIDAGGYTLAVQACGLNRLYPATNRSLGIKIIKAGGGIISEYSEGTPPLKHHFVARNRIVAGISLGVLVTEAAENSGSLITASFALESNRQVMAVPGNITSSLSTGSNNLIKAGATPVTSTSDILVTLGFAEEETDDTTDRLSADEKEVYQLILGGVNDGEELASTLNWEQSRLSLTLTMLELNGRIRNIGNNTWVRL